MIQESHFAKSIADVSWNQFLQFLSYKAVEAGRKLGLVNPAYTTQDCNRCGYREEKKLSDQTHHCTNCGIYSITGFQCSTKHFGPWIGWPGSNPKKPSPLGEGAVT